MEVLQNFIQKALSKHGSYTYDKVDYVNSRTKITISCPKHGDFNQTPANHLFGHGCPQCAINNRTNKQEDFIIHSKQIHGDRYFYSKVIFVNNNTKVEIECSKHGLFRQIPKNHVKGHGCPQCALELKSENLRKDVNVLLDQFKFIHGEKYDYTLVDYKNTGTKIEIGCPNHGFFKQLPMHHIKGVGCPNCSDSKGEAYIGKMLTSLGIEFSRNKTFDGCVDKGLLKFDFYLPKHNTCVEYDGIQHFKAIELFGGEGALVENKRRDSIKDSYCCDNKIQLFRIRYDENIINAFDKIILKLFGGCENNLYICNNNN